MPQSVYGPVQDSAAAARKEWPRGCGAVRGYQGLWRRRAVPPPVNGGLSAAGGQEGIPIPNRNGDRQGPSVSRSYHIITDAEVTAGDCLTNTDSRVLPYKH